MIKAFILTLILVFPPDDSISDKINTFLDKRLNQYDKYEYEIIKAPENTEGLKIIEENEFNIKTNIVYLPVIFINDGRNVRSFITLRLKLFRNVFVTSKSIKRKKSLSKEDFHIMQVDVTQIKGNIFSQFDRLNEYRTKVNINTGTVLIDELIETAPIVYSGEKVTASSICRNVLVSTEALSKQDGSMGEIITVITPDKKQFKAKVIDQQNVLIIE
jgi:flagella basal body P-ring formation protein FlgA